ncbi:MAG: restriction endonuclease subunit S [Chitinophagaceae bacterium]
MDFKNKDQLSKDWKHLKLGDVCRLKNGFAFKSNNYKSAGIPVIRISDIKFGSVNPDKSVRIDEDEIYSDYEINRGDILVAMSGATTGKFGLYKSSDKAYQNQRVGKFQILNKEELYSDFLFYQLHALKRQIEKDAYGGAQPNISSGKIEGMPLLLPPKQIQQAIVSKIEELFSELDKGIENLLTAQQQLKTYRQSVLKWAFEGRLSNDNLEEGEVPNDWKFIKLGEHLEDISSGKSYRCDERPPTNDEVGVIKVSSVTWGYFDELESKTCFSSDLLNVKYLIGKGDFLFSRANTIELIGACVIVDQINKILMLSDKILRFTFSKQVLKPYALYYLRSRQGRKQIETLSTGNQDSMRNIGQEKIRQITFPYCSIEEQKIIVQGIESRFSVADKLQETITQSLQQSEALRQSILKMAFEGRLVNE